MKFENKSIVCIALMAFAIQASAQWGGFIDPNIIRESAEMATGSRPLPQAWLPESLPAETSSGGRMPTAQEIAIAAREQQELAIFQHVQREITKSYEKEFGR
ncbi:hypothetical protein [Variovorax sp. N23]|uniref:hypothetical protein n=1 Tax=Variovorax sp. N23 TaxID=2980555 RepID=UPI0021C790D3|nr:hypothetical protein [Variovorax sp. N23]MCU4119743.1 hypothetical protein [Variovorax sp. N23]